MDISTTQIKKYLENFKEDRKADIANKIVNTEAFVNATDSPSVKILLDILSAKAWNEMNSMINIIDSGKYEEMEELRQIRRHCIGLSKIYGLIAEWNFNLNKLREHVEKMK